MDPCSSQLVLTPLYRTIIKEPQGYRAVEEPDFNYGPYQIFAPKSKLYPWIKQNIGFRLGLSLIGTKLGPKMSLQVTVTNQGRKLNLSPDQIVQLRQRTDRIFYNPELSRHVLIYYPRNLVHKNLVIGAKWISAILPFIKLDTKYDLIWSTEDVDLGALYVNLSTDPDYFTTISELLRDVEQRLSQMYMEGYVVNPSEEIIRNWQLVSEVEELWHLSTPLNQLVKSSAGTTGFLLDRVAGISDVPIDLSVDRQGLAVVKHYLAQTLVDFYFKDRIIYIPARNLEQSLRDLQNINEAKTKAYREGGKVAVLKASSEDALETMIQVATEMDLTDIASYLENYDLIFSVQIPFETNEQEIQRHIFEETSQRLLQAKIK